MSTYQQTVVQPSRMLRSLDGWLAKAEDFAEARDMSADHFVSYRLTPDMYSFTYQVQSCCATATAAAAQLCGVEPLRAPPPREGPSQRPPETTMAKLRVEIGEALAFLDSLDAAAFEGAEARVLPLDFIPGMGMVGRDYVNELALPNFYFHLTTAYNLLRLAGVNLGKMSFLGDLSLQAL